MSRAHELFARLQQHGVAAIDELISDFQSESLWLDFKRSADSGSGTKLHQDDRENLAKAMSGFANSDGGVILWGVDCRRDPKTGADLPSGKHPIQQPHRFVSWLEGASSSCVTPAASKVEHAVLTSDQASSESYVATLIPRSELAPHQCIQPSTKFQYYMRAGSNFMPVPHSVLAGMFGRRPQPKLFTFYDGKPSLIEGKVLKIDFGVRLMNEGPAPAAGAYLSFRIQLSRPNCRTGFNPRLSESWVADQAYGVFFNVTSKIDFRLAPHTPVQPVRFQLQFARPFKDRYMFEMHYGCDGAPPGHVLVELTAEELDRAYSRSVDLLKSTDWTEAMQEIFEWFIGQKGGTANAAEK